MHPLISYAQNFNLGNRVDKVTGARYELNEREKKAALRLLKKAGEEEQFVGMCARCLSTGILAKKNKHNDHYGCTDYCCPLLHQWNVCEDCLAMTRTNFHPVKYPERQVEHLKFQSVFSRLPDDVQRYIGEFVPQVFDYVVMSGRLFKAAKLFYNMERHNKLLKSLWNNYLYFDYQISEFRSLYFSSSGKEICRRFKQYYREHYRSYYLTEEVKIVNLYKDGIVKREFSFTTRSNRVEFLTEIVNLLSSD